MNFEEQLKQEIKDKESCKQFNGWACCDTIKCKLTHCETYDWECGKGKCEYYEKEKVGTCQN